MKSLIFILFSLFVAINSQLAFLSDSNEMKVYSMVWSGKHYNPGQIQDFFMTIPLVLPTVMKWNPSTNQIDLSLRVVDETVGTHKKMIKDAILAQKSKYASIVNFSEDYKEIKLSLDFATASQYALTNIKVYGNMTFQSVQIKITMPKEKLQYALYITFDFAKGDVPEADRKKFIDWLKKKELN